MEPDEYRLEHCQHRLSAAELGFQQQQSVVHSLGRRWTACRSHVCLCYHDDSKDGGRAGTIIIDVSVYFSASAAVSLQEFTLSLHNCLHVYFFPHVQHTQSARALHFPPFS